MMRVGVKPYECARCGECYEKNSDLVQHVKIHTSQDMFECVSCKLFFINEDEFKKHKWSHRPIRVAHFGCEICGKEFPKLDLLKSHVASHEGASGIHKCNECDETFSIEDHLIAHKMLHDNQSELACMSISSKSSHGSAVSKSNAVVKLRNGNDYPHYVTGDNVKEFLGENNNVDETVVEDLEEIDDDLELLLLLSLGK